MTPTGSSPVQDGGSEDGQQPEDHLYLLHLLGRVPRQAAHVHVLTLTRLWKVEFV